MSVTYKTLESPYSEWTKNYYKNLESLEPVGVVPSDSMYTSKVLDEGLASIVLDPEYMNAKNISEIAPATDVMKTEAVQDAGKMQGYAGLASSFAQLAALPGQIKLANLQSEGLEQNIEQQKVDNAFRATARSNLSKPVTQYGS